jgi:FtsP/CotA-like multicopper oxidase with cupredoxin domain
MIDRRSFLKYAGLVPLFGAVPRLALAADEVTAEKADYTLRIGTGLVELAPDHIVSTALYNGQFPGPLLRFKEGQQVVVDIHNDTNTPELVHWQGVHNALLHHTSIQNRCEDHRLVCGQELPLVH